MSLWIDTSLNFICERARKARNQKLCQCWRLSLWIPWAQALVAFDLLVWFHQALRAFREYSTIIMTIKRSFRRFIVSTVRYFPFYLTGRKDIFCSEKNKLTNNPKNPVQLLPFAPLFTTLERIFMLEGKFLFMFFSFPFFELKSFLSLTQEWVSMAQTAMQIINRAGEITPSVSSKS